MHQKSRTFIEQPEQPHQCKIILTDLRTIFEQKDWDSIGLQYLSYRQGRQTDRQTDSQSVMHAGRQEFCETGSQKVIAVTFSNDFKQTHFEVRTESYNPIFTFRISLMYTRYWSRVCIIFFIDAQLKIIEHERKKIISISIYSKPNGT